MNQLHVPTPSNEKVATCNWHNPQSLYNSGFIKSKEYLSFPLKYSLTITDQACWSVMVRLHLKPKPSMKWAILAHNLH